MACTHALLGACKILPAYSPCQVWEGCILGIATLSLTVDLLQKCLQTRSRLREGLQLGQELQAGEHSPGRVACTSPSGGTAQPAPAERVAAPICSAAWHRYQSASTQPEVSCPAQMSAPARQPNPTSAAFLRCTSCSTCSRPCSVMQPVPCCRVLLVPTSAAVNTAWASSKPSLHGQQQPDLL